MARCTIYLKELIRTAPVTKSRRKMLQTTRHLQRRSMAVRTAIRDRSTLVTSSTPSSIGGRNALGRRNSPIRISLPSSPSLRWMTSKQQQDISKAAAAKTGAGSGKVATSAPYIKNRGPVSWPSLFLVGIAAASVVAYYNIERERRLESAMGRVVSSESDGWSPNPGVMAPRKFKLTPWGYFPEDDGFGPCKFESMFLFSTVFLIRKIFSFSYISYCFALLI